MQKPRELKTFPGRANFFRYAKAKRAGFKPAPFPDSFLRALRSLRRISESDSSYFVIFVPFVVDPLLLLRRGGKDQRLDDHRHGARGWDQRADVDVVKIVERDAVDGDDRAFQFQFLLKM